VSSESFDVFRFVFNVVVDRLMDVFADSVVGFETYNLVGHFRVLVPGNRLFYAYEFLRLMSPTHGTRDACDTSDFLKWPYGPVSPLKG
jgi:hypothetical protein